MNIHPSFFFPMPILAKGHEVQEPFPASKSTTMLMFSESFRMCVRVAPPKTGECIATNRKAKKRQKIITLLEKMVWEFAKRTPKEKLGGSWMWICCKSVGSQGRSVSLDWFVVDQCKTHMGNTENSGIFQYLKQKHKFLQGRNVVH